MSYKVVATSTMEYGIPEEPYKEIGAELVKASCKTEDDIIVAAHDAEAIISMGLTGGPFTRRVMERLARCKLIHSLGLGYENIDVDAATDEGICVSYPAGYCYEEVSDHALALIFACARKLLQQVVAVREGKWDSDLKPEIRFKIWPPMFRLQGQTLGLIGFGGIPRTLAAKARAFELKVIAYDPYINHNLGEELKVEIVNLDRLLSESDYISVHAALTTETRHMLGLREFKKMKPTAYIINTARGQL